MLKRKRKRRKVCLLLISEHYISTSMNTKLFIFLCSGKLPKNCDPKSTPDPERWLPMRERSYYRGKKKGKKKEQIGRGTQGATSGATAEL